MPRRFRPGSYVQSERNVNLDFVKEVGMEGFASPLNVAFGFEYRVEHPRWRVWSAARSEMDGDFEGFYGAEFAPALSRPPTSVFIAEGSPVQVRSGVRLSSA